MWPKSRSSEVGHFQIFFVNLGFKRKTVYGILKRLENNITIERLTGSGRKSPATKPEVRQALKRATIGKLAKSYRELGRKFKCHGQTIKKTLNEMGIVRKARKMSEKN